jgi:CRISPR-associated endonuclease/helicase Cas3
VGVHAWAVDFSFPWPHLETELMNDTRLWAKKPLEGQPVHDSMLLLGHLRDVHEAAQRVLKITARDQLQALDLPLEGYQDRFERLLLFAAAAHDLGKANEHFQEMILGRRDVRQHPQGLRHEWVTVLILEELRDWLMAAVGGQEGDWAMVQWAIAGHHPALNHPSPPTDCPAGAGDRLHLLTGHHDFAAILKWLGEILGLGHPPKLGDRPVNLCGLENVFQKLKLWSTQSQMIWRRLKSAPELRLLAGLKASLIAADVAGSALARWADNRNQRWGWIDNSLNHRPEPGDLRRVVEARLGRQAPRAFQCEVAESTASVTFVKAGCGTGKTVAAYLWASRNHPTRRLYFCYPTTGTATEGFRDYLFEPDGELGDIGAKLFHSRRDIDLELILSTGSDRESSAEEDWERRAALDAWSTPIVACTVDTVLGLMQNHRRGLFSWPALTQAAFVFDEIHAYDNRLFSALLAFLQYLPGLPALLMTASLPAARLERLRKTLARSKRELKEISGPEELENLPRYHRQDVAPNDLEHRVADELRRGGKVLWIVNTVDRAIDTAESLASWQPVIYHSRFRYPDRVEQHRRAIAAFDRRLDPAGRLVICTQVAEMSLDLSADLLVTELAPIPSLIQRLGRLNRRAQPGDPTRPFIVIEPPSQLPYTREELLQACEWLMKLPKPSIAQRDLVAVWEEMDTVANGAERHDCAWPEGGPVTLVKELRTVEPSISVLLESDRSRIQHPKDLVRYIIPMPPTKAHDWRAWEQRHGIPVAPAHTLTYHPERGARWQK